MVGLPWLLGGETAAPEQAAQGFQMGCGRVATKGRLRQAANRHWAVGRAFRSLSEDRRPENQGSYLDPSWAPAAHLGRASAGHRLSSPLTSHLSPSSHSPGNDDPLCLSGLFLNYIKQ